MKKILCHYCKTLIKDKDKHVRLQTIDKGKVKEDLYFHFKCWEKNVEEGFVNQANKVIDIFAGSLFDFSKQMKEDEEKMKEMGEPKLNKKKKINDPLLNLA